MNYGPVARTTFELLASTNVFARKVELSSLSEIT
jgi:hypothetical protein